MSFSDNLKDIRQNKKLSQQELADKLDIAQSTVGMWESGKRTPKLAELQRLARFFGVNLSKLLVGGSEERVEIVKDELYIDGEKIDSLNESDIRGVVDYIKSLKAEKDKARRKLEDRPKAHPKKILIIDDEQEICELLYTFLVPHNYKVFLAFNGQMGLEYFEEVKPDLVFLDLKMPDIDGVEVLRILRKVSKTPVVILTGHPQDVSDIHLADLEIEGYIEKPVKLVDVLNTLKHILGE